jgi:hypothetical protein
MSKPLGLPQDAIREAESAMMNLSSALDKMERLFGRLDEFEDPGAKLLLALAMKDHAKAVNHLHLAIGTARKGNGTK